MVVITELEDDESVVENTLVPGTMVVLHSLETAGDLNGRFGTVLEDDPAREPDGRRLVALAVRPYSFFFVQLTPCAHSEPQRSCPTALVDRGW